MRLYEFRFKRCNFTEDKRFPFKAQIHFMLVVNLKNAVVKLTYGDDNGKFSLSGKSLKYDSKYSFLLAFSYKLV